jgi:DNA-binding NarL/FixJ family response regulator
MRVAICVRETLLREALGGMLSQDPSLEVVASAGKISSTLSGASVHDADLLIIDIDDLSEDELESLRNTVSDGMTVIALASPSSPEKSGVLFARMVHKDAGLNRLFKAIYEVSSKEIRRPRFIIREAAAVYGSRTVLTPRENEIALKVAEGKINREIAEELHIAEQTVKNLVSVVMRKLECANRTQLAIKLSKGKKSSHS